MKNELKKFLCLVSVVAGFAACGESTTTTEENTNRSPGGEESARWEEVSEDKSCGSSCAAGLGFVVRKDGSFESGRGATGRITDEELAGLTAVANPLSGAAFSVQDCEDVPAERGTTVMLTVLAADPTPGPTASPSPSPSVTPSPSPSPSPSPTFTTTASAERTFEIYDGVDNDRLCFRGDIASANALKSTMDALAAKYDAASPTPRPTASPSPTPSPSPSPSMTATAP